MILIQESIIEKYLLSLLIHLLSFINCFTSLSMFLKRNFPFLGGYLIQIKK